MINNVLLARTEAEGLLWLKRMCVKPECWRIISCQSDIGLRGLRPDAIFVTPMAREWLSVNEIGWRSRLRERCGVICVMHD